MSEASHLQNNTANAGSQKMKQEKFSKHLLCDGGCNRNSIVKTELRIPF